MSLTIVRIGGGLLGVIALITGGKAIWGGATATLGEAAATLSPEILMQLDNDYRFYAGSWLLVGVALIVGALVTRKKPDLMQLGLEAVIIGGFARLFAFTEFGNMPQFYPAIGIEIIGGGILFALFIIWRKRNGEST